MDDSDYEVVVVGDGLAGATTAIYTTRLGHATAVVDRGAGRHTVARHVHNYMGPPRTSPGRYSTSRRAQLDDYGTDYYTDDGRGITKTDDGFPRPLRASRPDRRARGAGGGVS